jgi:hypothetical protein
MDDLDRVFAVATGDAEEMLFSSRETDVEMREQTTLVVSELALDISACVRVASDGPSSGRPDTTGRAAR